MATLYFKNQYLTLPRCCTAFTHLDHTNYWLVGFTDGSQDYSAACIYLVSASKSNSDCKTQLVTSATQITTHKTPTDSTVPWHETIALQMGTDMLLHITSIMSELQIPIYKCILFCDNISTIISHNNHPANYISPMSRLLASANIQLYKIADIIGCQKQDIVLYINQKRHTNCADCLTKFNIIDDTPQMWLDL